ncbi:MAG: ABC transporter substrate binding protein [Candidatus Binatia bacterium]
MGVIWYSANPSAAAQLRNIEVAARSLGVQLQPLEIHDLNELESAFGGPNRGRVGALMTLGDARLFSNRREISKFAAKSRLPAIFPAREYAEEGGLMAYGPDHSDLPARRRLRG